PPATPTSQPASPYLLLFSEETRACLVFHFNSASNEVQKWGTGRQLLMQSNILSTASIKSLGAALKTALTLHPMNLRKMKLLFRATTGGFRKANFHEMCDRKSNTLTVIKTVGGKVVGECLGILAGIGFP
ncbi:hypothetical protein HDU98_001252, partial [Podochytrium sp. JEL0797]